MLGNVSSRVLGSAHLVVAALAAANLVAVVFVVGHVGQGIWVRETCKGARGNHEGGSYRNWGGSDLELIR